MLDEKQMDILEKAKIKFKKRKTLKINQNLQNQAKSIAKNIDTVYDMEKFSEIIMAKNKVEGSDRFVYLLYSPIKKLYYCFYSTIDNIYIALMQILIQSLAGYANYFDGLDNLCDCEVRVITTVEKNQKKINAIKKDVDTMYNLYGYEKIQVTNLKYAKIYLIYSLDGKKKYVGQSCCKNVKQRIYNHYSGYKWHKKNNKGSNLGSYAIFDYGAWTYKLLEECNNLSIKDVLEREKYHILNIGHTNKQELLLINNIELKKRIFYKTYDISETEKIFNVKKKYKFLNELIDSLSQEKNKEMIGRKWKKFFTLMNNNEEYLKKIKKYNFLLNKFKKNIILKKQMFDKLIKSALVSTKIAKKMSISYKFNKIKSEVDFRSKLIKIFKIINAELNVNIKVAENVNIFIETMIKSLKFFDKSNDYIFLRGKLYIDFNDLEKILKKIFNLNIIKINNLIENYYLKKLQNKIPPENIILKKNILVYKIQKENILLKNKYHSK